MAAISKVPSIKGVQLVGQAVPTSLTQIFSVDTYIDCLVITNDTSAAITVRIVDGQGTPFPLIPSSSIDANYSYIVPIQREILMSGGMSWSASSTGVYAYVSGRQ